MIPLSPRGMPAGELALPPSFPPQTLLHLTPPPVWRNIPAVKKHFLRMRLPAAILAILAVMAAPALAVSLEDSLFLGADALYKGRYDRAERGFSEALEKDPANTFAWVGLGEAHARRGQPDKAAAAFNRAKSLSPGNLPARRGLGLLALARGDYASAEAAFGEILELSPDNAGALLCLALGELLRDDTVAAVGLLDRMAETGSPDPYDHLLAGELYMALNMPVNARLSLETALEGNPRLVPALDRLGLVYLRLGKKDLGMNAWRQALAVDPMDAFAGAALSRLTADEAAALARQGRLDEAAHLWRAALACDPRNGQALSALSAPASKSAAPQARREPGQAPPAVSGQ